MDMKKILIAVAGFEYSEKVLAQAKTLAEAMASEVTIITVVDIKREEKYIFDGGLMEKLRESALGHCEDTLAEAKKVFENFSGKVETVCKIGNTADEILEYAESGGYDLIIVGSRGTGAFPGFRLGSVADKVVHYAKASVLIVK